MEQIQGWAAALCAVAVGCALLQMLAPPQGLGKVFRVLVAAFFLCCLVAPLLSFRSLGRLDLQGLPEEVEAEMLQERINDQIKRQIDSALLQIANQTLKNYGTQVEKVEALTDTSENGSICITKIVFYMDKPNLSYAVTVQQVMENRLGLPCLVQEADG